MAGNRTRINCLEGNYAHHYTTIAPAQKPQLNNRLSYQLFLSRSRVKHKAP